MAAACRPVEGNQAHQISHVTRPEHQAPVSEPAINMITARNTIVMIKSVRSPRVARGACAMSGHRVGDRLDVNWAESRASRP